MLRKSASFLLDSFRGLSREIWLLSLVTLINRSGTVVILFLTLYLTNELGFSKGDAGFIAGSFGVGSLAGAYLGGWLTDRLGYYKVIVGSLILVGFLFFSLIHFTTFWSLCIMLAVTSMVGDAYRPAGMAALSAYSSVENRTRSLSLYRLSINLGFAVGAGGAGVLADAYGYDWLFYIDGVTCILAGLVFIYYLKNVKEDDADENAGASAVKSAYQDYWYLAYISFLMLNTIAFLQLFSAIPVFCREELAMSEGDIGLLMTINGLLLFTLEMPIVHYLVQKKQTMQSIIWGVILIGFGYLAFNIFGFHYWVALLFIVFITIGEIINFPFATAIALERSTVRNRGQYMGLYSIVFSVSTIVGPVVGLNIVEDYSYTHLWYFAAGICAVATIGLLFLQKRIGAQASSL